MPFPTLIRRLGLLEAVEKERTKRWVESLSDAELAAVVEEMYGAGTWDWLAQEVTTMTQSEVEREGELLGRYVQWRESQA